ncbi:MAG: leucine-rich repeat protein, partial [Prevotella sp.]|nr:leucine-rich repeat protein [Prevotella sp.]
LTRINNDVKIIDLGFCDTDNYTFTAGMTKAFSAPEQLAGKREELDARTDIYTVGRLMEYIETKRGKRLPLPYRQAMKRSLETDKTKRFDSAKAMAKAINKSYKKLWIALSCITVFVAASIGWQMFKNSESHKYLMLYLEKDATIEGVHYKIISEEDASCMAIGRERHLKKDTKTGETNIYIKEEIQIDGKTYSVTEIADSAFINYRDFVSVNLPNSLRRIGEKAFEGSKGLVSVNIPEGITETEAKCFYKSGIRSVKLPTTLKTIKDASFAICRNLKSVDIPEGVETLGLDAFGECLRLQSVILPSTLRTISRGVFWKCKSLKKITIPASVETIGEYAFFHCDSLKHVYNYSTEPQPLSVIFNRKDITIHVPAASVEKYRKAQHWRDMNIVAMRDEEIMDER